MLKNDDFYKENARFSGLIKHYANKVGDKDAEQDLWTFLWVLQKTSFVILPDRYIAVCLRNRFYDILRDRKKHNYFPLEIDLPDKTKDIDFRLDIENALGQLEADESKLIIEHFFGGKSYTELAEMDGTTRQAKSQKAHRILNKMRGFF